MTPAVGMGRSFREVVLARLARAAVFFVRKAPYPLVTAVFKAVALCAWCFLPYHRKTSAVQLRMALGLENPTLMSLRVFLGHAEILVDAVRYAYMSGEEVKRAVRVEGLEHLERALETGKGVMMITGHVGNWEILSHLPRILSVEFCVMAQRRGDPMIDAIVDDLRSRSGATILPPTGKALMLVRELRKGRVIGMVVDGRHDGADAVMCEVFGMPAPTNPAPAFIAIKGDAVVLPVVAIKNGRCYRVIFTRPVPASDFGASRDAVERLSGWMQSQVEHAVRRDPHQWFWLYSRWIPRSLMKKVVREGLDLEGVVSGAALRRGWTPPGGAPLR